VPRSAIEAPGARRLADGFGQLEAELPGEVRKLEHGAAIVVVPIAKALAPYRSGRLSGAIKIAGTMGNGIMFGGPSAPHGPVVNFGGTIARHRTSKRTRVRSQEHIYRAIDLGEPIFMQMMREGIGREIEVRL
jgi:hypothetical protein